MASGCTSNPAVNPQKQDQSTVTRSDSPREKHVPQVLADHPRGPQRAVEQRSVSAVLDPGVTAALGQLSAECGRSIEDALLAGIAVWLVRYTGNLQVDFPVLGERDALQQWSSLRVTDETSFRNAVFELETPSEAGEPGGNQPLAAAWPVCFIAHGDVGDGQWLLSRSVGDLGFGIEFSETGTRLHLLYSPQMFEAATAQRMLAHLVNLLRNAAGTPDLPVVRLPILSDEERHYLLQEWNQTSAVMDAPLCLHQLVEQQARRTPSSIAIEHEDIRLTYAEFNASADALARYLQETGIHPGSHVGICLPSSNDFAIATLAVLKAGCACVPLDPKYPAERLLYMLEDAQARFVLTAPGLLPSLPAGLTAIDLRTLRDRLAAMPADDLGLAVGPKDAAYLIYTSGSTGKPRGVVLGHAGLSNYVVFTSRYHKLTQRDRVLQFCSLSFDIAVEEMFMTWPAGGTVVFRSENMPLAVPEFLCWSEEKQITVLDLPTAYWHEWVSQLDELTRCAPECLRLVIVGGEKALASAYRRWEREVPNIRWVNTYGPTEASTATYMAKSVSAIMVGLGILAMLLGTVALDRRDLQGE